MLDLEKKWQKPFIYTHEKSSLDFKLVPLYAPDGITLNKIVIKFGHLIKFVLNTDLTLGETLVKIDKILIGQETGLSTIENFSQLGQATYLMETDARGFKIGKSNNPEKRLKSMKTGNPDIELIAITKVFPEKLLHKVFYSYRRSGEWFYFPFHCQEEILFLFENRNIEKLYYLLNLFLYFTYPTIKISKENLDEKVYNLFVLKFGKYKGRYLNSLLEWKEVEYVEWFIKNMEKNNETGKTFYDLLKYHMQYLDDKNLYPYPF